MTYLDRVASWITDLAPNKRSCKLFGYTCVATFDISPEAISPLVRKILDALVLPEIELSQGRCDDIDIGLYGADEDGLDDVRAWPVTLT